MNTRESDFWNERSGPRIAPEHFGDIVATAADLAIVLSEGGTIISITSNPLNSAMGRMEHWEGRKIAEFLAPDSQPKVMAQLAAVARHDPDRPKSIEVNHIDGAAWDFPVRYTLHQTGRDGRVLMLGRDMRPLAELQQRLVRAQLALEKDYEAQRIYETRYRVLLDAASEAFVLVDVASGRILDLNGSAARMLGGGQQGLTGGVFAQEFDGRRKGAFIEELCRVAQDEAMSALTVPLRRSSGSIDVVPILFRNAGERVLLCRLVDPDLQASPAIGGRAEPLMERLADLYRGSRDAIVFTDAEHRIVQANDSFLSMMDIDAVADLRGRSMADILSRGGVDLKVLTEDEQVGTFATRIVTSFGSHLSVEMSATSLSDGDEPAGHGFVIRDTGRSNALRETGPSGRADTADNPAMANAISLVGSLPLRDIVASMTDVVERQCIEAAVDLTSNNRVAAAEMLGLSRQSLYVKLRKYGLVQRDEP
ncbi:MAG: transcriptional regulator PpsR [Jannaschia sp.]